MQIPRIDKHRIISLIGEKDSALVSTALRISAFKERLIFRGHFAVALRSVTRERGLVIQATDAVFYVSLISP